MAQTRSDAQPTLPGLAPANPGEMQAWLQTSLGITGSANSIRVDAAKPVAWADKKSSAMAPLMQPEHWSFSFGGPNEIIQADYWRENQCVGITTTTNGILAALNNRHKGTRMSVPWILLVDTLASSMIFLSLSGAIFWVQTNRKRLVGVVIFSMVASLSMGFTLACL